MTYVLVAVGGALGCMARYWAGGVMARMLGVAFPWGTVAINVAGSFAIGAFAAASLGSPRLGSPELRAFVTVGLCGGFTTFSAFSLQTVDLLRDGRALAAMANVALSVVLCLVSTACGYAVFQQGSAT